MRATRTLEVGTGLFVLLGFAALFFLTTQLPTSGLRLGGATAGYRLTAEFDNVGDLRTGSPVTMAGVRIGEVEAIRFDSRNYKAVASLRIDPEFDQIPDDSDASVQTQGLLGGKYVGIGPGGSDTYLADGGRIELTQSALVLENLVNRLFATLVSEDQDASGTQQESGAGNDSDP
jgi:phospholipid/cholesterol/gamma-HCH transport system substrate-binding protein